MFFFAIFWLLIVQTITGVKHYKATLVASIFTTCLIFSSLTFVYLAGFLYLWQIILLIGNKKKRFVVWLLVTVSPYLLYALFLLLSGSFQDFWFSNVIYNTSLYVSLPNYVRGNTFNPLKFIFTLLFNFHANYLPLLTHIKDFNLYNPIGGLVGLSTLTFTIYLFVRKPLIGLLFFFILSLSAPRSVVDIIKESDYQMGIFLVLGMLCAILLVPLLQAVKTNYELVNDGKRVVQLLIALYLLFAGLFLAKNTYEKWFQRYTQKLPSIVNLDFTASFMNKIVYKDEYFFVGPYEPHVAFFVHGKLPGKYPTLLPQFTENDYLKTSFIRQFEEHPPKYILLRDDGSIFGTPVLQFGEFFFDWMKQRYVRVSNLKDVTIVNWPTTINMDRDLWLLKSEEKALVRRLIDTGYLQQKPSKSPK